MEDLMKIPLFLVDIADGNTLSHQDIHNKHDVDQFSNGLHKLVTSLVVMKVLSLVLAFIRWSTLDNIGQTTLHIEIPYVMTSFAFETLICLILTLSSEGWCIIWDRPKLLKWHCLLTFCLFMMYICYIFVHEYFQGFAIVFVCMIVYIGWKCSTITISTIKRNMGASAQFLHNHGLSYKSEKTLRIRLDRQLWMMNFIQGMVFGLPIVLVVVHSVANFLLMYKEWLKVVLHELIELAVMGACAALFRLKDFEPYNNIVIDTPFQDIAVLRTPFRYILYISDKLDDEKT